MKGILNALEDGITAIDASSHIVFINEKASNQENIDIKTAEGRHLLEVYPSLSERTSTLLNVLHTGEPIYDFLQTFKNYKGEKITTINSTVPIRKNKKIIGAIEVSRDITNIRRLSEQVIDLKNELLEIEGVKRPESCEPKSNMEKIKPKMNFVNSWIKGFTFMDIVGQNDEMLRLKAYALKASASSSPVLIYGETGTGKELFVQAIHNSSQRKEMPFIAQNCAALPSTLLEGILFGTVRGSFTGAEDRPGLFELANGGTLYLDELNSMPVDLQPKLLRVLQDGLVRRVGDIKEKRVDVRVIASVNVDPLICMKSGLIRSDLYYRLNVISLKIPELKSRKSDIPIMIDYFIEKYNKKLGSKIRGITKGAMAKCLSYGWPGNVRELEHVIEAIINLKESGYIELDDLPENIILSEELSLSVEIERAEKNIISDAMKIWNNNVTKAAEHLGVPRQTLQYKIKKYGII